MSTLSSARVGQSASTHLTWNTFVTPEYSCRGTRYRARRTCAAVAADFLNSHLGERDAVLVDSFITLEQAKAQADRIASTHKNLTTIFATHGHGRSLLRGERPS